MKIGILGTGNMGRSLGILWAEQGHDVFFGARDEAKAQRAAELAAQSGHEARFGSNDQAAEFGEVLVYTARGVDPAQMLTQPALLAGKIVIDLNNGDIPEGFAYEPIALSLAEKLQAQAPQAVVVKAFNTMAQELFELAPEPLRAHGVSVFVASDDGAAKGVVMQLAEEIGFAAIDAGPLRNARLIEGFADFIRFAMIGQKMGPYTAISIQRLPRPEGPARLGGREASQLKS